jgi:formylmethanofuran dehydrogenase subunit B
MIDWIYLVLIIPLVAMELVAAFGKHRHWETISEIIQRFERHSKWNRILVAFLIILQFSHLVLLFP